MRPIARYCRAVLTHWGSLVTGGVIIGALGIWQGTGHPISSWVYAAIGFSGLVIAAFKAWVDQFEGAESAAARIVELQGRPDVSLTISQVSGHDVFDLAKMKPEMGTTGSFVFKVRNNGPGQAVNISIDDIRLPMSEHTKRQVWELRLAFFDQTGDTIPARRPGSDEWIVLFDKLTTVAQGYEVEIPYRIDNLGPLQNQDICYCLGNTVRPENAAPLHLPLTLRFSNRDGASWAQTYDLEHRFICDVTVTFQYVKPV